MGIFRRSDSTRSAYSTEPARDPESGERVVALRSRMTGGHIVSYHPTEKDAKREAKALARAWDRLR